MNRRDILLATLLVAVRPTNAQQPGKVYRIAWLSSNSYATHPLWPEFIGGMKTLGWIEGENFAVDHLNYEGRSERLPALAAEAVRREPDLIVCAGTPPASAAKNATMAIPIVFFFVGDPVGSKFVATLARPGGNMTGLGGLGPGVHAKMFEHLVEVAPKARRIAMLANPDLSLHDTYGADAQSAARRFNVVLKPVPLRSPDDLDNAFATIARDEADAVLILGQPFLFTHGARVARLTIERRLPAIIAFEEVAQAGVLMAYGGRLVDDLRRLPHYVDRIFKGASPAELPVEQPTRFYLTVNLRTAKAIGLAIAPSLRSRADALIE